MKNITALLALFVFLNAYSQKKFEYNKDGLNVKYLVIEIDSLNASEIYLNTIDWIKETYKNPDEVIKAKFENEKIRFDGFQENGMSTNMFGLSTPFDIRYSIEISFKDGRFKFEPINLESYQKSSQYIPGGWNSMPLNTSSWIYKKNGKIQGSFKNYPEQIERIFNNLKSSLEIYLLKQNKTIKDVKDDW
jgi:hypothetical protein